MQISFLSLIVLILIGCTHFSEKLSDSDRESLWLQHRLAVSQIHVWNINGRVGIKTRQDSGSASLYWYQLDSDFEMRIVAPLGQGTYIYRGSSEGVIMQGPDNMLFAADNTQQLMKEVLGWSVDLSGMQYWVRGIPALDIDYKKLLLDDHGRLSYLDQAGFIIKIERYTERDTYSLPEKLTIESKDLKLKLVIKNWEL